MKIKYVLAPVAAAAAFFATSLFASAMQPVMVFIGTVEELTGTSGGFETVIYYDPIDTDDTAPSDTDDDDTAPSDTDGGDTAPSDTSDTDNTGASDKDNPDTGIGGTAAAAGMIALAGAAAAVSRKRR